MTKHEPPLAVFFTAAIFIAAVCCVMAFLSGCACNGGIRNMSDEWCDKQSWDQETLQKQATTMHCADRSYVYGTHDGVLGMCQ